MKNNKLFIERQGYQQALLHYDKQKQQFLNLLDMTIQQSNLENFSSFFNSINLDDAVLTEKVDLLINEIEELINSDANIAEIKKRINNAYTKMQISKDTATQIAQEELGKLYTPLYIKNNILSKLGTLGHTQIAQINDNALLGKVKMLLNQAIRHNSLNPKAWGRQQIKGLLYEHAVVDGLQQFFANIPGSLPLVQIGAIGSKGGRGDIKIEFQEQLLNKNITGKTSFEIQNKYLKNFDYENFVTSHQHNVKLKVGAGNRLFKKQLVNLTPEYSMYLISKTNGRTSNVVKAIGENTSIYAFGQGQFKFTADLIQEMFFGNTLALGMPDLPSSTYIYWMSRGRMKIR